MPDVHCEPLSPADWDDAVHDLGDRVFIRQPYRAAFHLPIGLRGAVDAVIPLAREHSHGERVMVLTRAETPFKGDVLVSVRTPPPGGFELERVEGAFRTRLWRAHFRDIRKVVRFSVEDFVDKHEQHPREVLTWVATCPRCMAERQTGDVVVFCRLPATKAPA